MTTPSERLRARGRIVGDAVLGSGLVGPIVAMALAGVRDPWTRSAFLTLAGALVLLPHSGVSVLRAWRAGSARVVVAVVVLAAALAAVDVANAVALEATWTAALIVLPWHVALQAHRTGTVAWRRLGASVNSRLRIVSSLLLAGCGVAVVAAGPRVPLILRGALSAETAVVVAWACAVAAVAAALAAGGIARVRLAVVTGAPALAWVLPLTLGGAVDARLLAGGALAIGHATQTLWLAAVAEPRIAKARGAAFDPLAYFGFAFVVGALLLVDLPWVAGRAAGIDIPTVILAAGGAFALGHAVLDAVGWRLKDEALLKALVDTQAPAASPGRTLVSNARALAFAVPGFIVCLGLFLDVFQAWLVRPQAPSRELAFAEALAGRDARVSLARGDAALKAGDVDEARVQLGQLELGHAFAPESSRLRLTLCLQKAHGVSAERACLDAVAPSMGDDPSILARAATALLAAGQPERALALAERAAELLPDDPHVLAILGTIEARSDKPRAGMHLQRALSLQTAALGADALVGDGELAEAGFALARVELQAKRKDAAVSALERVAEGAETRGLAGVALRAHAEKARILDVAGDPVAALGEYQRSLALAGFANEPAAECLAWLDYGGLLKRSQAPADSQIACAEKAAAEAASLTDDDPEKARLSILVDAARKEVETGVDAALVKKVTDDLTAAAAAALALTYGPAGTAVHGAPAPHDDNAPDGPDVFNASEGVDDIDAGVPAREKPAARP